MPGKKLGEILVESNLVNEADMLSALASRLNMDFINNISSMVDPETAKTVSEDLVRKNKIIPLYVENGVLNVATNDPLNFYGIDDVAMATGLDLHVMVATTAEIEDVIEKLFAQANSQQILENVNQEFSEENMAESTSLQDSDSVSERVDSSPVVQLVNSIIRDAQAINASDIHIEPFDLITKVRFRVDGDLIEHQTIQANVHDTLVTRIKILSNMNIAEKRVPQDGGFTFDLGKKKIDIRASSLPTVHGEKVVMRLLGSDTNISYDLSNIGLSPKNYKLIERSTLNSNGIILVTGPTGSGKTTTTYSILQKIANPKINIVSVEDPVEKQFDSVNQVQANAKVGLTFASGLRSILRQDPDVVMIGEIRDEETAQIAIRAAITGHLVLSTIHTNDAVSTISRLTDMGIEPYLVAASLRTVISQRLVKKLCPHCKKRHTLTESEINLIGEDIGTVYEANGCQFCNETGYRGRIPLHEVLNVDRTISKLISHSDDMDLIKAQALRNDMSTLKSESIRLLKEGETSISEVIKLIYSID